MTEDASQVGYGVLGKSMFVLIPSLLGAGLGLALHFLLGWWLGLPWLPFQGPLKLLDRIPDQVALPVLMGLGVVVRDQGGQQYWRLAGGPSQLDR